jgi:hypothetical protein
MANTTFNQHIQSEQLIEAIRNSELAPLLEGVDNIEWSEPMSADEVCNLIDNL